MEITGHHLETVPAVPEGQEDHLRPFYVHTIYTTAQTLMRGKVWSTFLWATFRVHIMCKRPH